MILLDTHVWAQWVNDEPEGRASHRAIIDATPAAEILVYAISIWEISKVFELDRIELGGATGKMVPAGVASESRPHRAA